MTRAEFRRCVDELQDRICAAVERIDGRGRFHQDEWQRPGDGEARGVGGIFFDELREAPGRSIADWYTLARATCDAFLPACAPIVERRRDMSYGQREIDRQEIRRGRYAEFNLVHDRGTVFGLRTSGRIESILMSLTPRAQWRYDYRPEPGSPEAALLTALAPRDWLAEVHEEIHG